MTERRPHTVWRGGRDVYGRERVALVTSREAAALDAAARETSGVPERVLMETAGRSSAAVLDRLFPRGRVVVGAGPGNNGGDALVLARVLLAWGRDVVVFATGKLTEPSLLHGYDLPIHSSTDSSHLLAGADVIVDGLLGTGAVGAPRGAVASVIEAMNAAGRPILALDLPSGVDATTGRVEGVAVRAAATVSFGWPKLGLMLLPAREHCGRLIAVEIGFPPYEAESADSAELITPAWAAARLPRRRPGAHKGTAGRLLVLAGREGMAGAAALAAEAAYRAGAGLVRIASDAANRVVLQSFVPEATFVDRTCIDGDDARTMHALLAGPGIGADEAGRVALESALRLTGDRPAVLDADALNLYARDADALRRAAASRDIVVTPHPMELARLVQGSLQDVTGDPVGAARAASTAFGCSVVLKGLPSIIAAPDRPLLVNSTGSSDLASAGMGDQLAGMIGAFLAAGLGSREAGALALFYGARAADLAGLGRSLSPRDVSAQLHRAFADPGAGRSNLRLPFVTFDQPARW